MKEKIQTKIIKGIMYAGSVFGGMLVTILPQKVFAYTTWTEFMPVELKNAGGGDIYSLVSTVLRLLLSIAFLVAVVFLIFSGYQYITAGGDAEKATVARTGIINAIIGLIVIIASYLIVFFVFKNIF